MLDFVDFAIEEERRHAAELFDGIGYVEAEGWRAVGWSRVELRSCGVAFEEYDMPGLKTVDGIAHLLPDKVAWFKDPDGNVLSLVQEDA